LIVVGSDGASVVYRVEDGSVVATLDHGQPLHDAIFSPDSSLAVTFTNAGSFKVWLLPAGTEIGEFSGHSSYVAEAEFSPDNTRFVSMGLDHEVHVWNARAPLSARTVADIGDPIVSVSVAGPVRRIALEDSNGYAHVLDYETASGVAAFGSFAEPPSPRQTMSPDGKLLCTANDTVTPLIWNIDERTVAMHTTASLGRIGELTFSPDSKQLAIGYSEGTVCVVDVSSVQEDTILEGHTAEVTALAFLPDSVGLVTGSSAGEVFLWDTRTGSRVMDLPAHANAISELAVAPDGSRIITAGSDNSISVWDTTTGEGGPLATSPTRIASLAYLADINRIVTSTANPGGIRIWDTKSSQVLLSLGNEGHGVSGLHHDPGLNTLIVASSDGVLRELRAAPWGMADSSVSAPGAWLERYSAYRDETLSTSQIRVPYTHPPDVAVAVPRNVLAGFLDTVGDARRAAATDRPLDATIVGESVADLLLPLGIRAGDRFEDLNGVSFTAAEIDNALEESQQGIQHGDLSSIGLRLRRNASPVTFTYHVLDIVRRQERVELTAEVLLETVEQQRSIISTNRANILQVNANRRGQLSRLARDDSQGSGFWVVASPSPDARKAVSMLGLQSGDRIMSMDGGTVTSIEDVESNLSRMVERIRSNEFESTQLIIMRGAFLLVELTIVMV
jgi:WD40 repeat protein